MNKDDSKRKIKSPLIGCLVLGMGVAPLAIAGGGMEQESRWYLGASVSAVWASVPDHAYVNNGGPVPYSNDLYTVNHGTDSAFAVQVGYEWPAENNQWITDYSLGLQYEHYWLGNFDGTLTQYSLPQFLNYDHSWGTNAKADAVSLYSKIHVFRCGSLRPFVKAGIGWAVNRSGNYYETAFPGVTPRISPGFGDHTQNNFAYNLGAGADYDITPELSVSLSYNYQNLGTLSSGNGVDTWFNDRLNLGDLQANMAVLGVSYYFDS